MLEAEGLVSGYGDMKIIQGIDFKVENGEQVIVLGLNGAGKSTLLRTIAGFVEAKSGSLRFEGSEIRSLSPHRRSLLGITMITESAIFPGLGVAENLEIATYRSGRREAGEAVRHALEFFPEIGSRKRARASSLSGGQRKMLSMAMAMASRSKLLLMDEPSAGLSPVMVLKVVGYIEMLRKSGVTMVIAEQNPIFVKTASRVMIIDSGQLVFSGTSDEAMKHDNIRQKIFAV